MRSLVAATAISLARGVPIGFAIVGLAETCSLGCAAAIPCRPGPAREKRVAGGWQVSCAYPSHLRETDGGDGTAYVCVCE